jgi:hypothetical protein
MRLSAFPLAGLLFLGSLVTATTDPLNYRNIAGYTASNTSTATTALALIKSRPELSTLAEKIEELGGFAQAFDTNPNWKFTFFAPNNDAFESYTGAYFDTFETAPYVRQLSFEPELALLIQHRKGKWWLGNTILHHYVPNSALTSTSFNATLQRFQVNKSPSDKLCHVANEHSADPQSRRLPIFMWVLKCKMERSFSTRSPKWWNQTFRLQA